MKTEQIEILKLISKRLFTPIKVIVNSIFDGDEERAIKTMNQLENRKMIEYAETGRVVITSKGKAYVNKSDTYSSAHFCSRFSTGSK